jgi:hypothetical protein
MKDYLVRACARTDSNEEFKDVETRNQSQPAGPTYHIDKNALQAKFENLKMEQNLPLGILGGGVGGLLGAIGWAMVTYFTEYQIGWLAIGVAFLVGLGVSRLGKGFDRIFGFAGALIALFSVLLGNFLASIGFLARALEVGYFEMLLGFNYGMFFQWLAETFNPMDLLFYGLAAYFGYRFSFRKVSQAELLEGVAVRTGPPV